MNGRRLEIMVLGNQYLFQDTALTAPCDGYGGPTVVGDPLMRAMNQPTVKVSTFRQSGLHFLYTPLLSYTRNTKVRSVVYDNRLRGSPRCRVLQLDTTMLHVSLVGVGYVGITWEAYAIVVPIANLKIIAPLAHVKTVLPANLCRTATSAGVLRASKDLPATKTSMNAGLILVAMASASTRMAPTREQRHVHIVLEDLPLHLEDMNYTIEPSGSLLLLGEAEDPAFPPLLCILNTPGDLIFQEGTTVRTIPGSPTWRYYYPEDLLPKGTCLTRKTLSGGL
ncbi:unnamed protein product [Nezara viridula]|uniref:Uncharacterized protein n=1 Tax=Nezara viridula TaxID=85310 RepID=A0A9P0MSN4_NEZVI|nr:unnamed protein product [Nezara viridula]